MRRFRHALVRPPGRSYPQGLTTAKLGAPDLERALERHRAYCAALAECGLAVETLPSEERFPDSTFIEDTAVLVPECAIVTRPGAPSRAGETEATAAALRRHFTHIEAIAAPGTVDGGDICETERCVFIGLSERTNEAGGAALAAILGRQGLESRTVDIRGLRLLHLKSGLTDLGDGALLVAARLAERAEFADFNRIVVEKGETYAANAVRINGRVLVAAGFPRTTDSLRRGGYAPLLFEMSEYRKMDGGLSCLSLRF